MGKTGQFPPFRDAPAPRYAAVAERGRWAGRRFVSYAPYNPNGPVEKSPQNMLRFATTMFPRR
jgi:hypothetical protein